MKLSVKGSRIALIVANLVLAVGLLIHYAYNMFPDALNGFAPWLFPHRTSVSSVSLVDTSKLRGDDSLVVARKNSAQIIAPVATWVQPAKRPLPPPPPPPRDPSDVASTPPEPTNPDEPVEGGPLAEQDWTYAGGMVVVDDPERSFVVLKKKPPEDESSNASGVTRTTYGRRTTPRVIGSRRITSASKPGGSDEPIWLHVRRRHFIDEERELDFWIHSVSTEKFVYWTDTPRRMYSLTVDRSSPYYKNGRNEGKLLAQKEPDEDPNKVPEPGRGGFVPRPRGYESDREAQYRQIIETGSKDVRGPLQPTRISGVKNSQPTAGSTPPPARPLGTGAAPTGSEAGNEVEAKSFQPTAVSEDSAKDFGKLMKEIRAKKDLSEKDKEQLKELEKLEKEILGGKK